MRVRIELPNGAPAIELDGVTRLVNFTEDEAPLDFDPEAGPAEGVERTVYVNPDNVVCIILDGPKDVGTSKLLDDEEEIESGR